MKIGIIELEDLVARFSIDGDHERRHRIVIKFLSHHEFVAQVKLKPQKSSDQLSQAAWLRNSYARWGLYIS